MRLQQKESSFVSVIKSPFRKEGTGFLSVHHLGFWPCPRFLPQLLAHAAPLLAPVSFLQHRRPHPAAPAAPRELVLVPLGSRALGQQLMQVPGSLHPSHLNLAPVGSEHLSTTVLYFRICFLNWDTVF